MVKKSGSDTFSLITSLPPLNKGRALIVKVPFVYNYKHKNESGTYQKAKTRIKRQTKI